MTARALFARALAAVAVTGIAIAGPASVAGAAPSEPTPPIISIAPGGVTVDLGSHTVVTVGGPGAPRPGVRVATVDDGRATATVGNPVTTLAPVAAPAAPVLAPAAPLVGTLPAGARLLDADLAVRVCLVATLFGGDATGCTVPGATSTSGSPSVADAVTHVVLCARVAVLGSDAIASCDGDTPAGSDAVVPSSVVALATDAQACTSPTVLGTADPSRCRGGAAASADPTGNGGTDADLPDGAVLTGTGDACLGVAVLGSVDPCNATASSGSGSDSEGTGGTSDGTSTITRFPARRSLSRASTELTVS